MAKSQVSSLISLCYILALASSCCCEARVRSSVPVVNGLSYDFYKYSCPQLEFIIRKKLWKIFRDDIGQAAGLLRLHFHDCFVQGCDGSILLDGSERAVIPNLSLRAQAFVIINQLREIIHNRCGQIVSCSDITAIAARDSVALSGGPDYDVPLGRRDGLSAATGDATIANIPAPRSDANVLLASLATKNLDATDAVALSGGHTIGIAHCGGFIPRLYPTQDPTMETNFANNLKRICPTTDSTNTTVQDIRTPNIFDNQYYVDLMKRQTLFTSDQDLYTNRRTRGIVMRFATNQPIFFTKFVDAMIKMGQLSVLTGLQGQIRANCSVINSSDSYLTTVVEEPKVAEADAEA